MHSRVGRFAEAEAAFRIALDLVRRQHIAQGDTYCLLGLAATSLDMRHLDTSAQYLRLAAATSNRSTPEQIPPLLSRAMMAAHVPPGPLAALIQARLHIASGNPSAARSMLAEALNGSDGKLDDRVVMSALASLAELSLADGNAAQAIDNARRMLQVSVGVQGGLPHSVTSGQAWLLLGLAQQQLVLRPVNNFAEPFELGED